MSIKNSSLARFRLLPMSPHAQTPAIPVPASLAPASPARKPEPHHHLALHGVFVKVFNPEAASADSSIL
ncbi:MAG TPA: hypothetical protein VHS08_08345 [Candidatus Acidoferrales bacterium]|nr:hypothetical protein [Candidatus Acidoferrales bacterium]